MTSGIYIIYTNAGHFYVGQSIDIDKRIEFHLTQLDKGVHPNPYLQAVFNKYGADQFHWDILEQCHEELLKEREQMYIDKYFADARCMNVNPVAVGAMPKPLQIKFPCGKTNYYPSLVKASEELKCTEGLICQYLKRGKSLPPKRGRYVGFGFEYVETIKRTPVADFLNN